MYNTPLIWKWIGSMLLQKAKTEYTSSPNFSFSDFGFLSHYSFEPNMCEWNRFGNKNIRHSF